MRLLFISAIVLLLTACNNKKAGSGKTGPEDDKTTIRDDEKKDDQSSGGGGIAGVWRPVEINMGEMSEEERRKILAEARIEFTPSGNYISQFDNDRETGTYTYDDKEKTLVTKKESGNEERFNVEWKGKNEIKLTMQEGSMVMKRD